MKKTLDTVFALAKNPLGIFELCVVAIIGLCIFAIFVSIVINFSEAQSRRNIRAEKKSIVATGSMTLFFIVFYLLIRLQIGALPFTHIPLRIVFALVGLLAVVGGCYVNIKGRLILGKNWANQVKIYDDQIMVTHGVYAWVRHPLYASLMFMFYGASLIYCNWAAFLANTVIFIPFMYYRAKQEEQLLLKQFKNYQIYRNKTGMFFPKLGVSNKR